jgi:hypothetical protein
VTYLFSWQTRSWIHGLHLPIQYAIGSIDPRFKISADQVKAIAEDANEPLGSGLWPKYDKV